MIDPSGAEALTRYAEAMGRLEGAIAGSLDARVSAVEPPRPNTPDFEIYGIRQGNARLALREHGMAV